MTPLKFDNKGIRATVIAQYLADAAKAIDGVVCFSCGNSAKALRHAGLDVLEIGRNGPLQPSEWWTPAQIARFFPTRFDATSGHLPAHLMAAIGAAYWRELGDLPKTAYAIPSGSGETIVCLGIAYPRHCFTAAYDDNQPWTEYDARAPLNSLVETLFAVSRTQGQPTGGHISGHIPMQSNREARIG